MDYTSVFLRKSINWDKAVLHTQRENDISGLIQGNGEGRYFATSGYFDANGNLWVSGSLYLDGDITANSIFLAGESGIYGDLEHQIYLTSGTLSTEIYDASGALDTQLYSTSGLLRSDMAAASGDLETQLYSASGTLRTDLELEDYDASGYIVSQLYDASGTLDGCLYIASGILRDDMATASGDIVTQLYVASGTLRTDLELEDYNASGSIVTEMINASGVIITQIYASSGTLRTDLELQDYNASGAVLSEFFNASGNIITQLYSASGTLDTLIDTVQAEWVAGSGSLDAQLYAASGALDTQVYSASGLFLKKDGTTELTGDWQVGPYDLKCVDVTASGLITTNAFSASGTVDANDRIFYSELYPPVYPEVSGIPTILNLTGTSSTLTAGYNYRVSLNTAGTSTDSGAVYIIYQTAGTPTWNLKLVSSNSFSSNRPYLYITGTTVYISHNHDNPYGIKAFVETWYTENLTKTADTFFGLDSALTYSGGFLGLNNMSPASLLDLTGVVTASGLVINKYESITSPETLTLTPSGHYYEITNDGGGYDVTISLSGDSMPVGSILYIAYISTGGGRTCIITSAGISVLLSGGKEASSFIKSSVGWLPLPKGGSTA